MVVKTQVTVDVSSSKFIDLKAAVQQCWIYIGSDTEACAQECGERLTNSAAVEGCLDADRLLMYPGGDLGKRANDYVKEVCSAGGYSALHRALCQRIKLV